jgi:signal peptidase I
MYPTLGISTKYNIISKRHRLGRNLRVGDLIITKHPNFTNLNAGKRVIGLPGDFVVRDPHMARTVGGTPIAGRASGAAICSSEADEREEPEMIEVPPGHVWIAGDNMSWSRDSRFYGPVPMGLVVGKIVRYSNPRSDWLVDMVKSGGDQLRPARTGKDEDEWTVNRRSLMKGMQDAGLQEDMNLEKVERV